MRARELRKGDRFTDGDRGELEVLADAKPFEWGSDILAVHVRFPDGRLGRRFWRHADDELHDVGEGDQLHNPGSGAGSDAIAEPATDKEPRR